VVICLIRLNADYERVEAEITKAQQFASKKELYEDEAKLWKLLEKLHSVYHLSKEAEIAAAHYNKIIEEKGLSEDYLGSYEDPEEEMDFSDLSEEEEDLEEERSELEKTRETRAVTRGARHFVSQRNAKGETKLHILCQKEGNEEKIKELILSGHKVNVRDKFNFTPVHEAANYGFLSYVEILFKAGADFKALAGEGGKKITLLTDACSNGKLEIIQFLLNKDCVDEFQQVKKG